MKNDKNQILDEEDFWKYKELSNRQIAGLVQTKIRYPNYILSKINAEITRRGFDKNDLQMENLLEKSTATTRERFLYFYRNNKTATFFLFLFSFLSLFSNPWVSIVIIFSFYFSLKKNQNSK